MTRTRERIADTLILVSLALAAWQAAYLYAGESAISSPLQTLDYASSFMAGAAFWDHAAATLKAFAYAVAISIALGVSLGLLLGLQRFAGEVAEPLLASLYT